MFNFTKSINDNVHSNSYLQLKELAAQSVNAITIKINEQQKQIEFLAEAVASSSLELHSNDILTTLANFANKSGIDRIRLTTPDGKSYSDIENMIDISDRKYFNDAMEGNSGISEIMSSLYGGVKIVTIYAPIIKNNEIIGTIHGACELQTLNKALTLKSFGGEGFVMLFTKSGEYLVDSSGKSDLKNNVLESFAFDYMPNHTEFEQFRSNIENGRSGKIEYQRDGNDMSGYYMPVGINDWYILQTAPTSAITQLTHDTLVTAIELMIKALVLFVILLGVVVFISSISKREVVNINRELNFSNELLKVAFKHISGTVFTYDYNTQILHFENDDKMFFGLTERNVTLKDFAALNIFSPNTQESILQLFKRKPEEKENIECEIKVSTDLQEDLWYKICITNILNTGEKITRSIGTIEDITDRVKAQLKYLQEEKYRYAMLVDSRKVYEINVTSDLFRKLDESNGTDNDYKWRPYTSLMLALAEQKIFEDDKEEFLTIAIRDNLIKAYDENITELNCEYRIITEDGNYTWHESAVYLMKDPYTGNIMAFIYVSDITEQKQKEDILKEKAERDDLTKLYNRQAGFNIISNILEASSKTTMHGFLSVDVDNFKDVNDTYGHVQGDYVLCMVAKAFKETVREDDILIRMGGDEFVVFLNNVKDENTVKKLAKRICDYIGRVELDIEMVSNVTVSIGAAMFPVHGQTLNELYEHSDDALYIAKENGKNKFEIYKGEP